MNRFAPALLSLSLGLAPLGCVAADLAPPGPVRELANGSFDEPATDAARPPGWGSQGSQHGSARVVARAGASGGQALELAPGAGGSSELKSFMVFQVLDVEALRGKTLEFGARVANEGAGVNLVLWSPQGMKNELDADASRAKWSERRATFKVPENATVLTFGVQVLGPAGSKSFVDDAYVQVAGKGPRPIAKPSSDATTAASSGAATGGAAAAGGGSAAASVRIRAGERTRRLAPEFFGHHLEWVEDAQGLVKPGSGALDERVVQLLDEVRPALLRFPGGIPADFYDWKKGIGAQSGRGEIRNPFNKKMETVHFGSSELIALAKRFGAQACITANYGTGTPEMAGEWAKWFAGQGFRPAYWEVGNEIYLAGPKATGPNSKEIFRPGTQYAKDWPAFAAAIRGALPDAKVGAIAHIDTGAFPLADAGNPDWTVKMLDALDAKVDFFALHNGYAPVILLDRLNLERDGDRRKLFQAWLAAAQQTADNLATVGREIDRRSPVNAGAPLVITEFGTLVKVPPDLPSIDLSRTMASAVYVASVLDAYMADPRVQATMFTNPVHKWMSGLVIADASGPVTTPTFELYRFYADRFEHGLVRTDVTTPTYDAPAVGVVKARSDVPLLMARAGRSADGRRVTALLVNRALDGELVTELGFDGFVPKKISCRLLAAPMNATSGPSISKATQSGAKASPRDVPCTPAATQNVTLPAGSILSVVAEG